MVGSIARALGQVVRLALVLTFSPPCLLMLFLGFPAALQAQFTYTTNNGTIAITAYTGQGGAVAIPSMTNGFTVTSIGFQAFAQSPSLLTTVSIPDSITNIGRSAFATCIQLT